MSDNLLTRYVLDGGWTMVLLLPAAVISMATGLRAAWMLRDSNLRALAHEAGEQHRRTPGDSSPADVTYAIALRLYGLLQPLSAIYVISSVIGLLGSFTAILRATPPLQPSMLRQALLPPTWGLAISLFSYIAFVVLRARLFTIEREVLLPALMADQSASNERDK